MALRLSHSFRFTSFSSSLNYPNSKVAISFTSKSTFRSNSPSTSTQRNRSIIPKSTQESTDTDATEAETQSPSNETPRDGDEKSGRPDGQLGDDEASQLGAEIKKALQERADKEPSFLSGVGQEIGEIEWPAFGKVLGTTGVVLGVIAGSSVVLLTVNAVLAELSDRVFAGKGVQDFFG